MHGERRPTLGIGAHVGGVAEHFRQRYHGLDHLRTGAVLDALDATPAAVEIADDRAHELLGHNHFHRHDRLQQYGTRLAGGFFECHRSGNLEGHLIGVHLVIATVIQNRLHVHHLVAGEYAAFHGFFNPLVHRLDVLLGNHATHNLVDELVALASLVGLDMDLHVPVMSAAAGLADVLALRLRLLAHRL